MIIYFQPEADPPLAERSEYDDQHNFPYSDKKEER